MIPYKGKALKENMILLLLVACTLAQTIYCTDNCTVELKEKIQGDSVIKPTLEKAKVAFLMLIGFGGFSVLLAIIHNAIRKHVFHDSHNLDTAFDAGGRVTLSLTAVTVTSQMLWPADFLFGATISMKTGLGGPLFYAIGIVLDILLFPMLSICLKTRAPGAKTFLQIVYTRFGNRAHAVFCCFALLSNIVTLTALILAGKATLQVLVRDISDEFMVLILAVLFGSYCFVGGLGTTFYISYFNTALAFITVLVFIVKVSVTGTNSEHVNFEAMYEAMKCVVGPEGNYENSLLTFRSRTGIIYGLMFFLMSTGLSFCDQANWQSRIAAKPSQGVLGFFIAAFLWFTIPTAFSMMTAMTYMVKSYENGTHLLSSFDIDSGYISPYVMEQLMGATGGYLLITMVTMALMSTGSGEVMAISSILIYDIYKTHINPFRKLLTPTSCQLCGEEKVARCFNSQNETEVIDQCICKSAEDCRECKDDIKLRTSQSKTYGMTYSCRVHGLLRHYEDLLIQHKSWCIVWVTICVIPYGLIILSSGINLNWAMFTLETLLGPFLAPLVLTITWTKCTSSGVIAGSVCGLLADIAGILIVASTVYDDGLDNFMVNTAADYSLLGGISAGIFVSVVVTVIVSLHTHNINSKDEAEREWEKTLSIDNPLNPWRLLYKDELLDVPRSVKLTAKHMAVVFKKARRVAYIGGAFCVTLFLVVLPAVMLSFDVLTFGQFSVWIKACQYCCMVGAVFAIIVPPIEEFVQIYCFYQHNSKKKLVKDQTLDKAHNNLQTACI